MKKMKYKGRCEKRRVSKCKDVCKTYNVIQSAFADVLENDETVLDFECNVCLEGVYDNMYSSDFLVSRIDGSCFVRECVWRNNLNKPSYVKLLDISRNYWLAHGVEDWGIVIEKERTDEDK